MDLSLVILAAGMGSRFGGLKQITPISKSGESIIDFSVYDAIKAGFKKVIIIVRPEIKKEFHEFFGTRLKNHIQLEYVYQNSGDISIPARKKPLGTAHALLSAREFVDGPFSVINADDFYGSESFHKAAEFLHSENKATDHAVIGYQLGETLSEHGSVSRAECKSDENNRLISIRELLKVFREGNEIYYTLEGAKYSLPKETPVSMNFWCFQPDIFQNLETDFQDFIQELPENQDAEFLIPNVVNRMISKDEGTFQVIPTIGPWFGITYQKDFDGISKGISELIHSGLYPNPLWN
jgi:NDP-sugar pyrophosphorylase family protein